MWQTPKVNVSKIRALGKNNTYLNEIFTYKYRQID